MLRRIGKVIAVFVVLTAVLLAGVAVGGSLLLRSEWLGERILAAASGRLGLDIRAEAFSLGWGGDAALDRVQVRMPLRDTVVFSAERVELGLGALPRLVLNRRLAVRSVVLDRPTVFVRQLEDGRWNVQEVWTRVQAGLGSRSGGPWRGQLPQVVVRHAAVQITGAADATQTVSPIAFDGRRQGPLLWGFDLQAAPLAQVAGQVVEGGDWTHEIRFHVQEISPLIRRVLGQDLPEVRLAGRWQGAVAARTLRGAIGLDECVLGRAVLQGDAGVEATPERITIQPRGLAVSEPNEGNRTLQLADGAVEITRTGVLLESLTARTGAVSGNVAGRWDWEPRRGELWGSWAAAVPGGSSRYDGTYRCSVAWPRQGRREAQAQVTAQARTPAGDWQVVAEAHGGGADWGSSQWQLGLPAFSWMRGERQVELKDAAARVEVHWPEVRLTSLSIPAAKQADAQGQLDARTRRWSARVAVEQWTGLAPAAAGLDLRLSADGDDEEARIGELRMALGDRIVTAQGGLSVAGGVLRDVHVAADWPARPPGSGVADTPAGRWRLEADVAGRVEPLALDAQATLTGQKIALGKRPVDQVQVPIEAHVDARRVEATTAPFELLGGQWQVTGRHELRGRTTQVYLMAADLSLAAVAGMAGLPLSSQGQARAAIGLEVPDFDVNRAVAAGSWSAQDVNLPPLAARRAQGRLRIADGVVRLENIRLEQADGRARADASFRFDEPQVVSIEADAQGWPVSWAGRPVAVVVDGRTKLKANVVSKTADGEAQLTGKVIWQDKNLADIRLETLVRGQTLDVRELHAQALGGSADGTAVIPLNHWVDSVAQLRWRDVQPQQLAAWLPSTTRFQGAWSGTLAIEQTAGGKEKGEGAKTATREEGKNAGSEEGKEVAREEGRGNPRRLPIAGQARGPAPTASSVPAVPPSSGAEGPLSPDSQARATSDVRPLGPIRFVLDANVADGRFGLAEIGPVRVDGYLDPQRLLVDSAQFDVLGGRLEAQGRFSRHTGRCYGSIVTDFNELSLDQLVRTIDPNAGPHPGRLAGNFTVLPVFDRRVSLAGGGRLRLSRSDLADNAIVRTLYNTLSLHFGTQARTGTGEIQVLFEGPAIVLSSIQYFNRGVEIRGAGRLGDVNRGSASPIEGYAVASTRILKGVKLPGIGALDRLLDVLQTGGGSVKIAGALNDVKVRVVPLPEVLGPFRRLLWAQLRE